MDPGLRAVVIAVVIWTVLVLGLVLFFPNDHQLLPCMRLVGRSAACEADQATINAAYETYQTIPALVAVAAGYVGIAAARFLKVRRRGRPAG
jgi:hypothetical protein